MNAMSLQDLYDMVEAAVDEMDAGELDKFRKGTKRIMADSSRRLNKCDVSPELHARDCQCLRCLSLRVD